MCICSHMNCCINLYHICRFDRLQDRCNMSLLLGQTAMRWATVRLDSISLLVVLATSLLVTYMPSGIVDPSFAALALAYAMSVSVTC